MMEKKKENTLHAMRRIIVVPCFIDISNNIIHPFPVSSRQSSRALQFCVTEIK
jgi:hypothetical protein